MNSTNKINKEIIELYQTVKQLRSDKGCPWDQKQTSESLAQYLLQETYEVLESIDNKGKNLKEELGDLLFQILFQSVIADKSDTKFKWQKKHQENQTGTNNSFKPIRIKKNSIKKKYETWK